MDLDTAWSVTRMEQVRFMPNKQAVTSCVGEVTNPNFDICRPWLDKE